MKLRIPYFEVKRMIEKAFETQDGLHCVTHRMRELLKKRYLNDNLVTFQEMAKETGEKEYKLFGIELEALKKIRRYLIKTGNGEYITELQPTV